MVRVFAHGAMGRRIDPLWGGPIELFLVPVSALFDLICVVKVSMTVYLMWF